MEQCLTKTLAMQNIELKARQQELEQLQQAVQQMKSAQQSAELKAQVLGQQLADAQSSVASLQVRTCRSIIDIGGRHTRPVDCSRGVLLLKPTGHMLVWGACHCSATAQQWRLLCKLLAKAEGQTAHGLTTMSAAIMVQAELVTARADGNDLEAQLAAEVEAKATLEKARAAAVQVRAR